MTGLKLELFKRLLEAKQMGLLKGYNEKIYHILQDEADRLEKDRIGGKK